jgi:hypothetical protein
LNPLLVIGGLLLAASLVHRPGGGRARLRRRHGHGGGRIAAQRRRRDGGGGCGHAGDAGGVGTWADRRHGGLVRARAGVFRNVAPLDALKISAAACLKNVVPFCLYGVIYLVAAIVASIAFGLGWIVLVPVVLLTQYVAYKDLFEQ